jgi:hypothetical protein
MHVIEGGKRKTSMNMGHLSLKSTERYLHAYENKVHEKKLRDGHFFLRVKRGTLTREYGKKK